MEFETWMIFVPIVMLLIAFSIFVYASYNTSQKYGHKLKATRHGIFDRVRKTGIGKLPSNVAYAVKKKARGMGKPKPDEKPSQPEVKTSKKVEVKVTNNRAPEPNENPWNVAAFYYEQEDTTPNPCGNWRIGDKCKGNNGKEYFVEFNIQPGIYKGQKILYLTYPHLPEEAYKEPDTYQVSYEPTTFRQYAH